MRHVVIAGLHVGLSLVLLGIVCGGAHAMYVDVPMPILVAQSDLIVEAEVVAVGEPAEMEIHHPGIKKPWRRWYRTYRLNVKRVVRDKQAASRKQPLGQMEVLAQAPKPQPPAKPGEFRPRMADGPMYPTLRQGASYMLVMKRFPKREGYVIPSYFKNFAAADSKTARDIEAAADLEIWPWGQAKDGLQIALIPSLRSTFQGRTRQGLPSTFVHLTIALRNISGKPIAVNLYPWDRTVSAAAFGQKQEVAPTNLYRHLAQRQREDFAAKHTSTIGPGEILFIGPDGVAHYGLGCQFPIKAGDWKLQAKYASERKGAPAEGLPLWQGEIASSPIAIEVKAPPARRGR